MSDYFNLTLTEKRERLWVLLPGLLGRADELETLVPQSDAIMKIEYKLHDIGDYHHRVLALKDHIQKHANGAEIVGMGYSMGGRLLYSLIQSDPKLFHKAVFISSGFPLFNPKDRYLKKTFEQFVSSQLLKLPPIEFLKWWYNLPIYNTLKDYSNFLGYLSKKKSSFDAAKTQHLLKTYSSLNMSVQTSIVDTPSIYFSGEFDQKYQRMNQRLSEYFSYATFISVPKSSHLCHWESPFFLKQQLDQWLENDYKIV